MYGCNRQAGWQHTKLGRGEQCGAGAVCSMNVRAGGHAQEESGNTSAAGKAEAWIVLGQVWPPTVSIYSGAGRGGVRASRLRPHWPAARASPPSLCAIRCPAEWAQRPARLHCGRPGAGQAGPKTCQVVQQAAASGKGTVDQLGARPQWPARLDSRCPAMRSTCRSASATPLVRPAGPAVRSLAWWEATVRT